MKRVFGRRGFLAGALGAGGLVFGGCGFKPLYGTSQGGETASLELASVRVDPIPDRLGQILRNELTDRFTAGVGPQPTRYKLLVELREATAPLQIQTSDTITRYNVTLTARFQLIDSGTGNVVYDDLARAVGSYDVVESEFATLVAEQETAREAARDLSSSISGLLALYFKRSAG